MTNSPPTPPSPPHPSSFASRSPKFREAVSLARLYGPLARPVFFHGPVGAGKTTLARETHGLSCRPGRFVAVSAADLPEGLYGDALFGHRKGAFTGAGAHRSGLVTLADRGTLLIDDMAFLPTVVQAAILRVVESGAYRPLGAKHDREATCRFLFASTRSLSQMVDEGILIADLASRIGEMNIAVPGLADRQPDIMPLAERIARRFLRELAHNTTVRFADDTRRLILGHLWPGNLRELTGVVERAVVHALADGAGDASVDIQPEHLPRRFSGSGAPPEPGQRPILTRQLVRAVVAQADGNQSEAARRLGVHRNTVARYLR